MENGCYWTVENSWILPKGFAKNNDGRTQIPVSYTHLDVYKRQHKVPFSGVFWRQGNTGTLLGQRKYRLDGGLTFQGRNRLEEGAGGVLAGRYGYVRLPEGRDL